jgi:hypothetical protein
MCHFQGNALRGHAGYNNWKLHSEILLESSINWHKFIIHLTNIDFSLQIEFCKFILQIL